jgi:hypothetical protein
MGRRLVADVRLRGTWERDDTTRDEVTFIRRQMRELYRSGAHGYFTAARPKQGAGMETRRGTFRVTIEDVPQYHTRAGSGVGKPRDLESRALQTLKWLVKDMTCRAPTLTLDRSKTTIAKYWVEEDA